MILLIPYFLFVLFISYTTGVSAFVVAKRTIPQNPFSVVLAGFPILAILSQWLMIFGPINGFSILVILVGAIVSIWRYQPIFTAHAIEFRNWISSLSKTEISGFILYFLLITYVSSLPTRINDMGMYYLQTLQWMKEYGMVIGIGNLHPAYGLGSAWHSLCALFDGFSQQLNLRFFALNGVLLFSIGAWIWVQLKQSFTWFWIGYGIMVVPLGYLYLSAPSPDWPLLVYTPILFYYSLIQQEKNVAGITLLACFLFAVKPPAFMAVIAGLWILRSRKFLQIITVATLCLTPVFIKNYFQTGYLLYPAPVSLPEKIASYLNIENNPKWKIPAHWNEIYRKGVQTWGLNDRMDKQVFIEPLESGANRFIKWLSRKGYKGLMNKLLFANMLFALTLLFTTLYKTHKWLIGLLMIIQIVEWYYLSQYRLLLPTGLSLFAFNLKCLGNLVTIKAARQWTGEIGFAMALALAAYAFIPMNILQTDSRNKQITQSSGFTIDYLIQPYFNYQQGKLDSFETNGIYIHYYSDRAYAWDCPLPAMSLSHRGFARELGGIEIAPLGNTIREGFYLHKSDSTSQNTIRTK